MSQVQLIMPKMGESVTEAIVIRWLKNEGDFIKYDESLLEIATDKVDSEVPSSFQGVLVKKLFGENDVVQVGSPVAIIETEPNTKSSETAAPPASAQLTSPPEKVTVQQEAAPIRNETADPLVEAVGLAAPETKANAVSYPIPMTPSGTTDGNEGRFYSPLVKSIAQSEGVSKRELDAIEGTGTDGRVTKADILGYLPNRTLPKSDPLQNGQLAFESVSVNQETHEASIPETASSPVKVGNIILGPGDEIIEMDRMRRLISEHMVMSKHTSAHVTSFIEADVTNIVLWREKVKEAFMKKEKENITYTPIFIEAVVKAIKELPMINVSVNGTKIILRKGIHIGMAAALPSGNLIVPVIKHADQMNLFGITKSVNDLAHRARIGKLEADEVSGGTFTVTNVGTFGNVMGTPIINQPQVAILALGAIKKKPAVIETAVGDVIAIRHMMFLSLSYDHRVVDGALGGSFLKKVATYLETFDVKREIN